MRLAYFDPTPVPGTAPPQIQILYTVDGLAQAGIEVVLVTPRPVHGHGPDAILGRPLDPRVELHHLLNAHKRWWLPTGSSRLFYRQASRIAPRLGADVLLVRNLKMAERLLQTPGCPPLFFETHELFAQSFREHRPGTSLRDRRKLAALTARERYVYTHARGLFALTHALAADLQAAYGCTTPVEILPDGVDLAQADGASAVPEAVNEGRILYLGSLHPWKGVEVAVRAMAHLTAGRLQIVGGTRERIAALRTLAESLGVEGRVELVGPVAPHRRFDYIKAAAVCLLPLTRASIASRYTSPLKLFEYLAAGRAIVASDLPSMREVITPEVDGLLVPPEEPAALAAAIDRLLSDAALRHRLGGAARTLADGYDWRQRARRMVEFISHVAPTGGEPTGTVPRHSARQP